MSYRHHILDILGPTLSHASDYEVDQAIETLLKEHQMASPSIEDRAARAEALSIFALEKVRRIISQD